MAAALRLVADYRHDYTAANNGFPARARVRVFEGSPGEATAEELAGEASPVVAVVMTDLPGDDGPNVTNNVEQLAGEIVMRFALPSSRTSFIEHYLEGRYGGREDPETFDLVTFDRWDPEPVLRCGRWILELGVPSWKPIDRQAVEDLIGRGLDDR